MSNRAIYCIIIIIIIKAENYFRYLTLSAVRSLTSLNINQSAKRFRIMHKEGHVTKRPFSSIGSVLKEKNQLPKKKQTELGPVDRQANQAHWITAVPLSDG